MTSFLKKFSRETTGAVTVDWVVLSAAIVGLCVSGIGKLNEGVDNLAVALSQGVETKAIKLDD